jgi:hypothetical protein
VPTLARFQARERAEAQESSEIGGGESFVGLSGLWLNRGAQELLP